MKNKSLFDEYEIKEKLGEGAYGCVYKVQQKSTGYIRAVKAIKRRIWTVKKGKIWITNKN